jgi:hypothetical protein
MKFRDGFVSNSSSSSFVISSKKPVEEVDIKLNVSSLVSRIIETVDELKEYYFENNNWSIKYNKCDTLEELFKIKDYLKEEFEQYKKEIEKGNILSFGQSSNDGDEPESYYIYENGFPKAKNNEYEVL